ncbi:hypothetical protein BD311DRAFT_779500 [Dichomitus squalens]|uniref:Uncharacterized protein n=1 Tax=Dichomitus squalens TaxID=114155 RepID=A0A4V6MVW2_9APHY|nr:hypothetical protein BD311DRAFT_779500 [Dichomitus squalens]
MTLSLWEPFAASHGHESRATGEEGEAVHRDGNIPRYATHSLPRSDAFKQHCCNFPPPAKHRAKLRSETLGLWRHRRIVHFLSADRAILASAVASSHIPSRTMVAAYSWYRVRVGASVEGLRAQSRARSPGSSSPRPSGARAPRAFVFAPTLPLPHFWSRLATSHVSVCMIWEKPRCYSTPSCCLYFCRFSDNPPKWLSSIAAEDIAHTYATCASASNELVK